MRPHGGCIASESETVILDRLAGLTKIISPEVIEQALSDSDRVGQRRCQLSHRTMLWVVLAMGLLTHLPLRQVFKYARRMTRGEQTPARSSLCEGRQRLGVDAVRSVFEQVVRPLATPSTPGAFYQGFRLMAIDGTVQDVPDTPANADHFGRSSGGRGDSAFPQLRKVSVVEVGTHVEVALVIGGYHDGEPTLVEKLWDKLPADSLLLEDRGFFSYEHWNALEARGVKLLVRIKSNMVLKPIRRLAEGSFLTKIYPSSYRRSQDRDGIVVRVIEYALDDPQRTGPGEPHRLMTNLLDAEPYPAMELVILYHERWEEELVFDEQKTHLDPRRAGKPAHFRSQTPVGVEQEVYALSLGHFTVRALMLESAQTVDLDVDRLSFTGCLRILQARLPECESATPQSLDRWYTCLLWEMAHERIEPRRNRINPRVVKRKMSKFAKKRPQHRGGPPLKKTFAQTVVIT
ncbi:IS4 family transposase [Fimbriiglobus ruber]|uniref:Mobile element protein n=1 Tax=Fimbriiglobus ruber TaxID=1908690 RepID=A0A225DHY2_9BACT|nr:IS4 family transposase [Fimbriiglobus ruber]OWK41042.1 Mobile element protein [Fimbriiglobus ruber]